MKKSIYIIKNDINNKVYIGQSIHPKERFAEHCYLREDRRNSILTSAICKYGKEHFWMELLEENIENYDEREKYWIAFYNSIRPNGYNISSGGEDGNSGLFSAQSVLTKEKLNNLIHDLQNTSLTNQELSDKYKISKTLVTRINNGRGYAQEGVIYPLRPNSQEKAKNSIEEIYNLLKYTYRSYESIAQQFNLSSSTIGKINRGEVYHETGINYPIRKSRVTKQTKYSYEEVTDIIELLINTNLSLRAIGRMYNDANCNVIQEIKNGTNKLYYREEYKYPLRSNDFQKPVSTISEKESTLTIGT